MALVQCPECSRDVSDKAENCPGCGCPINAKFGRESMVLDTQDKSYIHTVCPRCRKEGKINRSSTVPAGPGYLMKGTGTCPCGFSFDKVMPEGVTPDLVSPGTHPSRRSTAGLLALILGGAGVHKFYLGQPGGGLLYLLCSWTFIPAIISVFTAISYFGMTDDVFNRTVDKTHPMYRG